MQYARNTSLISLFVVIVFATWTSFAHAQDASLGMDSQNRPVICDSVSADGTICIKDGQEIGPTLSSQSSDLTLEQLQQLLDNAQNAQVGPGGLFSCSSGDHNMPVGTLVALNSANAYVPVFDAAVTQNTGYLLYKECVLDGLIVQYRQVATTVLTRAITNLINTGDNGEPLFQTDPAADRAKIANRTVVEMFKEYNQEDIHPAFRQDVYEVVAKKYAKEISGNARTYAYSREDEDLIERFSNGTTRGNEVFKGLLSIAKNPSNSGFFASLYYDTAINSAVGQAQADYQMQVIDGFKPVQKLVQIDLGNGETADRYITVTPGLVLAETLTQALGSGFRQLENASEVNEIIDSAFSGLSSLQPQILSNPDGLAGVSQQQPGQQFSFLDAIVNAVSSIFGSSVANSALAIVSSALSSEQAFYAAKTDTFVYLNNQKTKVLNAEKACWVNIEQAVRSSAGGVVLNIATTTEFSDAALGETVTPLINITATDLQLSASTIAVLQQLAADVSNSNSSTVQQIAISQVDALVASNALHDGTDTENAKQSLANMKSALGPSLDDTIAAWATTTVDTATGSTTRGWCNTSDSAVVQSWVEKWRQ